MNMETLANFAGAKLATVSVFNWDPGPSAYQSKNIQHQHIDIPPPSQNMANKILAATSYISTALHLYTLYTHPTSTHYSVFILFCLLISIVNHSTTSTVYKWADRCAMAIGMPITLYASPNMHYRMCTLCIIPMYGLAKWSGNVTYHVACHCLITYVNINILMLQVKP